MNAAVFGFDASQFQNVIDWAAVHASGKAQFAYGRATDGPSYTDPDFIRNHDTAKLRGIPFGAYHFWRCDGSPQAQAKHFLDTTINAGRYGPLLPMVDVEELSFPGAPGDFSDVIAQLSTFLAAVNATLKGERCILYTNYDTWQRFLGNTPLFHQHPLWLAQTESPDDGLYGGWSDWLLWQDGTTLIPGIQGAVDYDILNPAHEIHDLFR